MQARNIALALSFTTQEAPSEFASMNSTFMPEKRVGLVKADPNDHHGFTTATLALRDLAMA